MRKSSLIKTWARAEIGSYCCRLALSLFNSCERTEQEVDLFSFYRRGDACVVPVVSSSCSGFRFRIKTISCIVLTPLRPFMSSEMNNIDLLVGKSLTRHDIFYHPLTLPLNPGGLF